MNVFMLQSFIKDRDENIDKNLRDVIDHILLTIKT